MTPVAGWDHETDLLVFGSGVGGLAASLFGTKAGMGVILCEKTSKLGGTTATTGGVVWIPGTRQAGDAGVDDSIEHARDYLQREIGNHYYRADLIDAFLASGGAALAELEAGTEVKFDLIPWPDYHPDQVGAVNAGRSLCARVFDGRRGTGRCRSFR